MIPEIEVTCRGERLFINSVTVEQYKKYISLMEKNDTEKFSGVMFFNKKIMQEMFGNELSLAAVGEIDAVEFLTAIKTVHFIMQNIVAEKMLSIVEVEQVEKEASAFDDYDRENGYEDEDEQSEENQWKVCGEIVDRVVKIAIRLLKNSYSQCMKENIVTKLDYLIFELDTINDNQYERRRPNGLYKRQNIGRFEQLSITNEIGSIADESLVCGIYDGSDESKVVRVRNRQPQGKSRIAHSKNHGAKEHRAVEQ